MRVRSRMHHLKKLQVLFLNVVVSVGHFIKVNRLVLECVLPN